jgi:hypothetical protein
MIQYEALSRRFIVFRNIKMSHRTNQMSIMDDSKLVCFLVQNCFLGSAEWEDELFFASTSVITFP